MSLEFLETQNLHINNQVSNYVLNIYDTSELIIMNLAVANTITIPNDATVDFLIGARIYVQQTGVGQTSIVGALGVTINSQQGILSLAERYCMCELIKTAANTWTIQGGIIPAPIPATNYGLFAQTANSIPIAATTTEGTLIGGGVGTLSVPANGFQVGDSFVAKLYGHITCVGTATIQIRIKSGSVLLGDTGIITLDVTTNKHWNIEVNFTIRSLGNASVGSIVSAGLFSYIKNSGLNFEGANFVFLNNTTFDTTILNTLDITAQWNTNNAGNSIYSDIFILNKVY